MKICQSLLVSKDGNFDQAKRDDVLTGRGAFTNYVCIFWHSLTRYVPIVYTSYVVNYTFF